MAKVKPDPIFLAYAESAPLEDLRFYLRYAARHLGTYSATTRAAVAEMVALEARLPSIPAAMTRKRAVWSLIDRFKSSIPRWAVSPPAAIAPEPLTALTQSAVVAPPAPKAAHSPSWRVRAIAAEAALAKLQQKQKRPAYGRKHVDWVAAGRKAWETRQRRLAAAKRSHRKPARSKARRRRAA